MQWSDDAIVLGVKRHGEANAIAELFTHAHGRHLGLVRGGFGSRMKPVLQPGNSVSATWRARLDEHLGTYTLEPVRLRTASMFAAHHALFAVTHLAALARLPGGRPAPSRTWLVRPVSAQPSGHADLPRSALARPIRP